MTHGKKYLASAAKRTHSEQVSLEAAVALVKSLAFAKFDETVEVAIRLNLKGKHTVRDTLVLPHGFRAEKKILVFAKGEKAEEARASGAAFVGDQDLIEKIQGGWLDFDVAVATPDMMSMVGRLGRILGPKGLMPNPKTGTVTFDIKNAVREIKAGKIEYRVEKAGIIHAPIGKASFAQGKLEDNFYTLMDALMRAKPAAAKGTYVRSVAVANTMGPGIKISPSKVTRAAPEK